jgi:hypothetical protein
VHKIAKGLLPLAVDITIPKLLEGNPRKGDVEAVARSLKKFGQRKPLTVHVDTKEVLTGNHTLKAALSLGWDQIAVLWVEDDPTEAKAWVLADNRTSELGGFDNNALIEMLAEVAELDEDLLDAASYTFDDIDDILSAAAIEIETPEEPPAPAPAPMKAADHDWEQDQLPATLQPRIRIGLSDRFVVPPFSVLSARDGWWQDRKTAWIDLGIEGELGREDKPRTWYIAPPTHLAEGIVPQGTAEDKKKGVVEGTDGLLYGDGSTSIFDPTLTELVYRWFCPPGGQILDPCAGGSVRGVVASKLGRKYTGIELRQVQVDANERQRTEILTDDLAFVPEVPQDNLPEVTPIEAHREISMKREDSYAFAGVRGSKVRTCVHFIEKAKAAKVGVTTAGSRHSPQVNFVAQIAHRLGVPCRVHVPTGDLTPELIAARAAGAKIIQHEFGRNSVIMARAREDAEERGWIEIPYGMESQEAIDFTKPQVANVPADTSRIVNACGSGMTLAGILWGLVERELDIPVVAVCVGNVPEDRLDRWAPPGWRDMVTLIDDPSKYEDPADYTVYDDVILDAYYEAKCVPYLKPGDLLWVSAIRPSAVPATAPQPVWICGDGQETDSLVPDDFWADLVFTCPPYGDLEVYSDDERDLSTMGYDDFMTSFANIMHEAYNRLNDDSFCVLVVGDYRDKDGYFHNFPGKTTRFMQEIGFSYLNEAILVTHLNSLPIRTGRQFDATRKMGKTHQQCLVFVKGDAARAADRCGPVVSADSFGD